MKIGFLVIVITLVACEPDKIPQLDIDPLSLAFRGKGILFVQEKSCLDSSCTTMDSVDQRYQLDANGNIIERKSLGSVTRYSYGNNSLVKQELLISDISIHYCYSYEFDSRQQRVFQYRSPIRHLDWNFSQKDIEFELTDTVVFLLENARVSKEIDKARDTEIEYRYDKDLLVEKNVFRENENVQRSQFFYSRGKLHRIIVSEDKLYKKTYEFDESGLLISAIEKKGPYSFYKRYLYKKDSV